MKKELIQLKIMQIVVDALLIVVAFVLSYFLRVGFIFSSDFPFDQYTMIALVTTPITIFFMFFSRVYRLSQNILSLRHVQRIGFVALMNVAVFMVLYYFTYRLFFSRLVLIYIAVLTFILIYAWHVTFRWILQACSSREIGVYRALIIGAGRPAEEVIRLLISKKSHIRPVAVIDAHGAGKKIIAGVPVVGKMNLFEKTIADHDIDLIIQTDHLEQTLNILNYAFANNLQYLMPPHLLGIFQGHQKVEETEGMPMLNVTPRPYWWHAIW
ncbi:MAG: hypothetical protein V1908_03805 [Candidatus Peregrinibacteria bacterium]